MQCRPLRRSQHNKRQLCRPTDQWERTYERNGERTPMNYSCAIIKPEKSIIPRDALWLFLLHEVRANRGVITNERVCACAFWNMSFMSFCWNSRATVTLQFWGGEGEGCHSRCCVLSLAGRTHTLTHTDNHRETDGFTHRNIERVTDTYRDTQDSML